MGREGQTPASADRLYGKGKRLESVIAIGNPSTMQTRLRMQGAARVKERSIDEIMINCRGRWIKFGKCKILLFWPWGGLLKDEIDEVVR